MDSNVAVPAPVVAVARSTSTRSRTGSAMQGNARSLRGERLVRESRHGRCGARYPTRGTLLVRERDGGRYVGNYVRRDGAWAPRL